MVKKRLHKIPLFLLVALLFAMLLVMAQATENALPDGFSGEYITDVNFDVDADFAWHLMTETEAQAYELTDFNGSPVYVAGNSGNESYNVSNIAITVNGTGALTFEYALSTYAGESDSCYYLGYSINSPMKASVLYSDVDCIARGKVVPADGVWASHTISVDSSDMSEDGTAIIYIAYSHDEYYGDETDLNYAAVRNISYTTGSRSDVVAYDDIYAAEMGAVTAQLVTTTTTTTTDEDGNEETETTVTYTDADVGALDVGSTYRLKATANENYRVYGWVENYTVNGNARRRFCNVTEDGLEITVNESTTYTPIFAPEDYYVLRKNATFYSAETTDVATVINEAVSGDFIELLADCSLSTSATIKPGVTVYIPYRGIWCKEAVGAYEYKTNGSLDILDGAENAFVTLTIPENTTLTVNGNLTVGSVLGYHSQRYQAHVSGPHGRIENNGEIVVSGNIATLSCYGIISGNGRVYATNSGNIREPLVICDFSGGSNSLSLMQAGQMPFKRYALQNIQCKLELEASGKLSGIGLIYALSGFNAIDIGIVGKDESCVFLIKADSGLVLEREYNKDMALQDRGSGSESLLDVTGIGKTTWTVYGGLTFQALTLDIGITISTASADFPLPYNFEFYLKDGIYDIPAKMRIMPGASITICEGATMNLGGRLMIMDGLIQGNMSGDRYPTRADLTGAGFSGTGRLIVNGTLNVLEKAALGGVVESDGSGMIFIDEGAYVLNSGTLSALHPEKDLLQQSTEVYTADGAIVTYNADGVISAVDNWVQQDGAPGTYDDNTVWFNCPARLWNGTEFIAITPGAVYVAAAGTCEATDTYTCRYVADSEIVGSSNYTYAGNTRDLTDGVESFTRSLSGVWSEGSSDVEIGVSALPNASTSGITVKATEVNGVMTVETQNSDGTAASAAHVHLVKITYKDGTVETVKNDAGTARDGTFTLPEGVVSVSIESAMLGDLTGDGQLKLGDYKKLKDLVSGRIDTDAVGELGVLASDITGDGQLKLGDYKKLKDYISGRRDDL